MEVILSPKAFDQMERFLHSDEKLAQIIQSHINRLPLCYQLDKQLRGQHVGRRSHRVGDYRILYTVEHGRLVITVIVIAHRRDVYDV